MTVFSLALERLLRASGWMMWHAVGQSRGLLTVAITVLGSITVITVKMLELFVTTVSWDGSRSMTMRNKIEIMHPIHLCTLVCVCMYVHVCACTYVHVCDSINAPYTVCYPMGDYISILAATKTSLKLKILFNLKSV